MSKSFDEWYKDQKEFQKEMAEQELGIVRCKECKYFSQNDRWCERYECSDGDRLICWDLGEDGFCSRGEKR